MKNNLPKLGTPTASGYRCSKGFIRRGDKLVQQVFWLGSDPTLAVQRRSAIDDFANRIEPDESGRIVWTDDLVTEMKSRLDSIGRTALSIPNIETREPVRTEPLLQPTPLPAPVQRFGLTLHEALDQFCNWLRSRNEVAGKTNENNCHRVRSIKFHLPDAPLNTIGFDQLQTFRSIITARPPVRRQKDAKVKRTPRPISLMTTRNWLQVLGQAFKWFRKTGRWNKPSHLEMEDLAAVFFLSKTEIMRLSQSREEKEKINKPKPTLSLAELAIYYKLAAPGQRLYLLMGICLGWRQRQIADLRRTDIVVRNGEYFVKFMRTKTGVEGDLWLCPELAALLIERVSKTPANHENYALLTENNLPLVHLSGRGYDTDSIKLTWGGDLFRRRQEAHDGNAAGGDRTSFHPHQHRLGVPEGAGLRPDRRPAERCGIRLPVRGRDAGMDGPSRCDGFCVAPLALGNPPSPPAPEPHPVMQRPLKSDPLRLDRFLPQPTFS